MDEMDTRSTPKTVRLFLLTRDSALTPVAKVHITARGTRARRSRSSVCIAREGAGTQSWNSYQGLLAPRLQGSDLLFFEI